MYLSVKGADKQPPDAPPTSRGDAAPVIEVIGYRRTEYDNMVNQKPAGDRQKEQKSIKRSNYNGVEWQTVTDAPSPQ